MKQFVGLLVGTAFAWSIAVYTAPTPAAADPLLSQSDLKRALVANRSRIWKDPDSIRDARIGEPYPCPLNRGTCICIEANGRNAYGGFTGIRKTGFAFMTAADFEVLGEMGAYATCGTFTPFPEMNGARRSGR